MVTQNEFREHILRLLNRERTRRASLLKQLEKTDANITALEVTLNLDDGGIQSELPLTSQTPKIMPLDEIRKAKTLPEALVRIAKYTDRPVSYSEAAKLVLSAGLSHGKPRNIASHIYNLMKESAAWEKVGRGLFKYIEK